MRIRDHHMPCPRVTRHRRRHNLPIGPAPVTSTSSPSTGNASAVCTALPNGSKIAATSRGNPRRVSSTHCPSAAKPGTPQNTPPAAPPSPPCARTGDAARLGSSGIDRTPRAPRPKPGRPAQSPPHSTQPPPPHPQTRARSSAPAESSSAPMRPTHKYADRFRRSPSSARESAHH